MPPFSIVENLIDPERLETRRPARDAVGTQYIVIQSNEVLTAAQKQDLDEANVVFQEYLDHNTYLCKYSPGDLGELRSKTHLSHVDIYHPADKINPTLKAGTSVVSTSSFAKPSSGSNNGSNTASTTGESNVKIVIELHEDPARTALQVLEELKSRNLIIKNVNEVEGDDVRIDALVERNKLEEISKLDEVRSVTPLMPKFPNINRARTVMNDNIYQPDLITGELTECAGSGEIIHIADSGFDKGDKNDVHPAFDPGRLISLYRLDSTPGAPTTAEDTVGHGTHVAGCALAEGLTANMSGPDAKSAGRLRGTAPAASFVITRIEDDQGDYFDGEFRKIVRKPYLTDGARISNHSYGSDPVVNKPQPGYNATVDAKDIDRFVFNNPDLLICWAAGNKGAMTSPAQQISYEAAAKNVLTVGATRSPRNINGNKFDRTMTKETDPSIVHDRSSRGPTVELRFKPDLCAPGVAILSTLSRKAKMSKSYGKSDDPNFMFESGTSMASPLVSGCAAVLREVLVRNSVVNPSAALMKALLINGCTNISASSPAVPLSPIKLPYWNGGMGFGRINMAGSLASIPVSSTGGFVDVTDDQKGLKQAGEHAIETVTIPAPEDICAGVGTDKRGRTLKVTLVWTDRPGPTLVNYLGLGVFHNKGGRRFGNMGDQDDALLKYDVVNNVQQIVWTDIPDGKAYIKVACSKTFDPINEAVKYAVAWTLE